MTDQEKSNIYLISDSSGETVSVIFRAIASQLPDLKIQDHIFPLIKTTTQIDEIFPEIIRNHGMILCTIIDQDLLDYLFDQSAKHNIKCKEVLLDTTKEVADFFGTKISYFGRKFIQNEDNFYYERMRAINFTIAHDDGQMLSTAENADIIILGISRTSKSPVSIYLANRGFKVANIPIIKDFDTSEISKLSKTNFIIALYNDPERLILIRKQRMQNLSKKMNISYIDYEEIAKESEWALNFYRKMNIAVIDTTNKAVEESAAIIIQYYNRYLKKN